MGNVGETVFISMEVVYLVLTDSYLAFAASPARLASTVRELVGPLTGLRFPIRRVTVVVSLTLEFIPALLRRASGVARTRGTQNTSVRSNGVVREMGTFVPVLVPLFISTFEETCRLTATVRYHYCHNKAKEAQVGAVRVTGHSCMSFMVITLLVNKIVLYGVFLPTTIWRVFFSRFRVARGDSATNEFDEAR